MKEYLQQSQQQSKNQSTLILNESRKTSLIKTEFKEPRESMNISLIEGNTKSSESIDNSVQKLAINIGHASPGLIERKKSVMDHIKLLKEESDDDEPDIPHVVIQRLQGIIN